MNQERAEALTQYLTSDPERAKELLAMEPAEALEKINAAGYDFTMEELTAYCDAFKAAVAQGELDEDQLENVSGGVVLTAGMVLGLLGCFAGGAAIGIAAGAKW